DQIRQWPFLPLAVRFSRSTHSLLDLDRLEILFRPELDDARSGHLLSIKVADRKRRCCVFRRDFVVVVGKPFILASDRRLFGFGMRLLNHSSVSPKPASNVCFVTRLTDAGSLFSASCHAPLTLRG